MKYIDELIQMLFNSIDFLVFLPIVFLLHWFVFNKTVKLQNIFIVFVSYVFYGWWDWRFLSLILFSTSVDFIIGYKLSIQKIQSRRKLLLWISLIVNLGLLAFFKYFNFFIENFISAFSFFGKELNGLSLQIILPIGISFYTFQTLSYTIDIYRKKITPTKSFFSFAAFVSFFPQLVAGPIEKASDLLPQFFTKRVFIYGFAVDGLKQILWGFFKKVVIADNAAVIANQIFNNSSDYSGSTLVIGAIFFTFQIYGDFSGYSDIAIGTSKLFGIKLKQNFATPYFSRDIAEFWRRWHISLTSWFKDYLYIPLGGSRVKTTKKIRNIFIIFIVSGFWHGANWTFIIWGLLNAIYFLPLILLKKNRKNTDIIAKGKLVPSLNEFINMGFTFSLTVIAWIFFRAESISHAFKYLSTIFSKSIFAFPDFVGKTSALTSFILITIFLLAEWVGKESEYSLQNIGKNWQRPNRWLLYIIIIFTIGMFMETYKSPFIYFQF